MCYWFPVGAGDFSVFALIQQFCLLNSNLGVKHFSVKPKLEDHPVGREVRSIEGLQSISTERALPVPRSKCFHSRNLSGRGRIGQKCLFLELSFSSYLSHAGFLQNAVFLVQMRKKPRADQTALTSLLIKASSSQLVPLPGPGIFCGVAVQVWEYPIPFSLQ